jgi:hypothetical protein
MDLAFKQRWKQRLGLSVNRNFPGNLVGDFVFGKDLHLPVMRSGSTGENWYEAR